MLTTGSKELKDFSVFNAEFSTTNLVGFGRKLVEKMPRSENRGARKKNEEYMILHL